MDLDEFRSFVLDSGIDVWTWIDMAISVASTDYADELKSRRDGIIQKLYDPFFSKCQNCDHQLVKTEQNENSELKQDVGFDHDGEILQPEKTEAQNDDDEEEEEQDGDDHEKILEIKNLLNDEKQDEICLNGLLQKLVDMDITFQVLKETDIGRHVTRFRKHSSNEVRRLVRILVRKWKDTVDEWVSANTQVEEVHRLNGDKESSYESQPSNNTTSVIRQEVLAHGDAPNAIFMTPQVKAKDKQMELDNNSSRKRSHWNQNEDQHAKKQRKAQIMDYDHIPKAKNAILASNTSRVPVRY